MTNTIVLVIREVPLRVVYEYLQPEAGRRERGTGAPLEPDFPAEVDVLSVSAGEIDITALLGEDVMDEIRGICEAVEEHCAAY